MNRRESFANDRELLLHRPVAPSRNAPNNLNTRLRTTHTTGRMTARIRITLADHFALRTWNAQTAQSAQTMQGGPQTTLTPVRFLWHVQRVEEQLRFHRCSVEIVGAYRNPIQCRACLVARPSAKELDGEIHHETAFCFAPSIPRQREV